MIWFTADTHFNHGNVVAYSGRPFADLEQMTEAIIERWNSVVAPGDTVFHLGDFALSWGRKHRQLIDHILSRLRGQKWLIVGNHDRDEVTDNSRWHKIARYHELKVDPKNGRPFPIVLSHYPMRSWNRMYYGAWMLHGHCHGNLLDRGGKIADVGVDCWAFTPVSLDCIAAYMEGRSVVTEDHHTTEAEQ